MGVGMGVGEGGGGGALSTLIDVCLQVRGPVISDFTPLPGLI